VNKARPNGGGCRQLVQSDSTLLADSRPAIGANHTNGPRSLQDCSLSSSHIQGIEWLSFIYVARQRSNALAEEYEYSLLGRGHANLNSQYYH
jgi:hypothetical protein